MNDEKDLPPLEFPVMTDGTAVVVRRAPGVAQTYNGMAFSIRSNSCDVIVFGPNGTVGWKECLHATDPRCVTMPREFDEPDGEMVGGAFSGVFDLAPSEKRAREMEGQLAAQQKMLDELVVEVHGLKERPDREQHADETPDPDEKRSKKAKA